MMIDPLMKPAPVLRLDQRDELRRSIVREDDAAFLRDAALFRVISMHQFQPMPTPCWMSFACGLQINMETGEVVIPEGMTLDDASRAFWTGLRGIVGAAHDPVCRSKT